MVSAFFLDTSALAKRYIPEIGTQWIISTVSPGSGNIVITSKLFAVEMFSALARRRNDGSLSAANVSAIQQQVLFHVANEYLAVSVDDSILRNARTLVDRHALRTLDSIQLACAVVAGRKTTAPITFLSSDPKLLTAAAIEGFAIDNPLNHP
jgi:hypothetical protein